MRKNTCPGKFKNSGKKWPFDEDLNHIEVDPAHDSIMNKSLNETGFTTDQSDCESSISHSTQKNNAPKLSKTPRSILKTPSSIPKKNLRFDDKLKKSIKTLYQEQSQVLGSESLNTSSGIACKVKIAELDCSGEDLHYVMNSEPARSSESAETNEYWISDLCLTLREREEMVKNKTLTSWHMEAVNMVARNQFPNIQGFQLTEKVPQYIAMEEPWNIGAVINPVEAPACKIYHTDRDHWVISFLVDNTIYLFDS